MAKFQVGDKIRGLNAEPRKYLVTNEYMTLGVVTETYGLTMTVKVLKHDLPNYCGKSFDVVNDSEYFALVERNGKKVTQPWADKAGYDISIYRAPGSHVVVAEVRSEGNLFAGSAKCSSEDEFDICTGARLAMERALKAREEYLKKPKERVNSRGVKVGDLVRVTAPHFGLEKGDLAEVIGLGTDLFVYLATPKASYFDGSNCETDKSKLVQPFGYTAGYEVLRRQPVMHKPGERK